jgi:hypothetical protein
MLTSAAFVKYDDSKNMEKFVQVGSTGLSVLLPYLRNAALAPLDDEYLDFMNGLERRLYLFREAKNFGSQLAAICTDSDSFWPTPTDESRRVLSLSGLTYLPSYHANML